MTIRDERRTAVLEPIADHLLANGLAGASLRALAAAAGTSDRMLLYYFDDKDDLLAAALGHVASRLAARLEAAVPAWPQRPFAALLAEVWAAIRQPALQPYMRLWLELAAHAGSGAEPHRAIAAGIADGFVAWAASRLRVTRGRDRMAEAALLSATVDGLSLLAAVGRGAEADAAAGAVSPAAPRSGIRGSPRDRAAGSPRSR